MRVQLQRKIYIFFFIATIILLAPFLIFNVNAQYGSGHAGLVLNPHKGHGGDTVQVSLDLNTWVGTSGEKASPYLYSGKTFSFVWDIGGWTNNEISALPDVIMKTSQWERIGSATFDSSGHLTGTATIPNRNEVGDHLLYAINEEGLLQGSTMDFWWGFFEINSGGTILSPSPSPSSSLSPSPSPSPTTHPDFCTLTVKGFDSFSIQIQGVEEYDPYSVSWPWGTRVSLYAIYTDSSSNYEFGEWQWVDSNGNHAESSATVYIDITSDLTAEPKKQSKTSGIPGFPLESIAIGLLLSLGLLYMVKKKSGAIISVPKQIFKPSSRRENVFSKLWNYLIIDKY